MPLINYIQHDGSHYEAEVPAGTTIMQGALDNGIDGILAECGGSLACATCHCYIEEDWREKTGEADEVENDLLEMVDARNEKSRLSCQITVTEDMEGLTVHLPESQF